MKPEAKIKADIRAYFRNVGAYIFAPVQTGMGMSTVDQLVCFNGKFIGIEVKVPGKHPTARQINTIDEINKAGGLAFWATSLEEVKEKMRTAGWVLP